MYKATCLAAAISLAAALPSLAQSELERLEAATEAASLSMEAFLVARAPELADVMVNWDWDEEMRNAARCTLDAVREEGGDEAVASYLDAMDEFAVLELTSLDQIGRDTPVPINPDFAMATSQACGTAEISMRRMQESGLIEAMMNPEVMGRLMAE